jgi:hypothetical protein
MSLHRALGGYESTGLHNTYQPSLDMSDLLSVDRAVLLGTTDKFSPDMDLSQCMTVVRIFLPITFTESSSRWGGERYDPHGDALEERTRPGYFEKPPR